MRLLLMSDTHIPARARDLPAPLWHDIASADVVIHAGDWISLAAVEAVRSRSRSLLGVYGNNDGPEVRAVLPEIARAEPGGLRVAVVHETGPKRGREARCESRFPDCDLLVFGHSHIPWDSVASGGMRLLNPGSPTDRRAQPHATYMTARILNGSLQDVELHRLPHR
jgi:uncharacterized protein